jgi:hypothetical protein
MNGVEFITDIVNYILKHAMKPGHTVVLDQSESKLASIHEKDFDDSRFNDEVSIKNQRVNKEDDSARSIEKIEAKTLHLCVLSIKYLVNEDIQAFIDLPLDQRIRIFFSMTRMLGLSFAYYPRLPKRKLKEMGVI